MKSRTIDAVRSSQLPPALRAFALNLALYADHDTGKNIHPTIRTLMRDTGYGETEVRNKRRELLELGALVESGAYQGTYGLIRNFDLDLDRLATWRPATPTASDRRAAAAREREARPGIKQARQKQARQRRLVGEGCTSVQGVLPVTPCTPVLRPPAQTCSDPLHSGAPINPYVPSDQPSAASAAEMKSKGLPSKAGKVARVPVSKKVAATPAEKYDRYDRLVIRSAARG